MDRLILLRHGQAETDSPSGDDFDRRLTPDGEAESRAVGDLLADLGVKPDIALVSAAARAQGTWAQLSRIFPGVEAQIERALYLADADTLRTAAEAAGVNTVLMVAHNPGVQELALDLMRQGATPTGEAARLSRFFPTAAAAIFLFDANGRPQFDGFLKPSAAP